MNKLASFTNKKTMDGFKNSLKIKNIEEFKYQNEGDSIKYQDLIEKRKKILKEQDEAEDYVYKGYDEIEEED